VVNDDKSHEEFGDARGERSWGEYRRLILAELERLNRLISDTLGKIEAIRNDDIAQMRVDIAMLKVKAGVWGALGGLVTGATAVLLIFLRGH
jgi:hypothetical protein